MALAPFLLRRGRRGLCLATCPLLLPPAASLRSQGDDLQLDQIAMVGTDNDDRALWRDHAAPETDADHTAACTDNHAGALGGLHQVLALLTAVDLQ